MPAHVPEAYVSKKSVPPATRAFMPVVLLMREQTPVWAYPGDSVFVIPEQSVAGACWKDEEEERDERDVRCLQ